MIKMFGHDTTAFTFFYSAFGKFHRYPGIWVFGKFPKYLCILETPQMPAYLGNSQSFEKFLGISQKPRHSGNFPYTQAFGKFPKFL